MHLRHPAGLTLTRVRIGTTHPQPRRGQALYLKQQAGYRIGMFGKYLNNCPNRAQPVTPHPPCPAVTLCRETCAREG